MSSQVIPKIKPDSNNMLEFMEVYGCVYKGYIKKTIQNMK